MALMLLKSYVDQASNVGYMVVNSAIREENEEALDMKFQR